MELEILLTGVPEWRVCEGWPQPEILPCGWVSLVCSLLFYVLTISERTWHGAFVGVCS